MYRYLFILLTAITVVSCNNEETKLKSERTLEEKLGTTENLIVKEDHSYVKYYPGKKQIEMEGELDDNGKRHGKWTFYNKNGVEISTSTYKSGLKQGISKVNYPNGKLWYTGEYMQDTMIGTWLYYDKDGKLNQSVDYNK